MMRKNDKPAIVNQHQFKPSLCEYSIKIHKAKNLSIKAEERKPVFDRLIDRGK